MDKKNVFRLSLAFGIIYFFSTNGMASLPGIAVNFLLKDVLKMTAAQAAYFGAATLLGWVIKPLWGMISDAFPLFGYRRKSYLVFTSLIASAIWLYLGHIENYTVLTLIILFIASAMAYAFNDVVCDGLMVETGKPTGLTGRFQSVQWGAVYIASIITGLCGGWVAEHWSNQTIFSLNAVFPVIVLITVLLMIGEEKALSGVGQFAASKKALKDAVKDKSIWLVAFFLFFWNFSPSFGTPFFYYSVDNLKFDKIFLGYAAALGSASSLIGAVFFSRYSGIFEIKKLIYSAIILGVATTLFDLIYFTPMIAHNLDLARWVYLSSVAILGALGTFIFLTLINSAAVICPKYSEGTTFAALMSFWNLGSMGSAALGGWLFDIIGLQPLIVVSAVFTALTWFIVPFLRFPDNKKAS